MSLLQARNVTVQNFDGDVLAGQFLATFPSVGLSSQIQVSGNMAPSHGAHFRHG